VQSCRTSSSSSPYRSLARTCEGFRACAWEWAPKAAAEEEPENSFIANASFTRAPLNSRVPPVSPHRLAGKRKDLGMGAQGGSRGGAWLFFPLAGETVRRDGRDS
jgi:hypothetical protein